MGRRRGRRYQILAVRQTLGAVLGLMNMMYRNVPIEINTIIRGTNWHTLDY
jgi:hypothetical protein